MQDAARFAMAALLVVAGASAAIPPASAAETPEESFAVALNEDGSARVALALTFDLTTDSERAAFDRLRTNETAREQLRPSFAERLDAVAAETADATGRSMRVENASVDVRSANGVGVVELAATWHGLAAVDGDRLVIREPFASGFQSDRRFVVTAPDGYTLSSVSPAADTRDDPRAAWAAGTSLDGFELVATEGTAGAGTGFGVAVAVAAIAGALLVRRW